MVKLSYHFYELVHTIILDRKREDFPEYLLHHIMTFALIMFSYCFNYIPIGAAIMFVHDLSDLTVTILKLVVDTTHKIVETATITVQFSSWCFLRLFIFPTHIIRGLLTEVYFNSVRAINFSVMNMMLAFLIGL